VIQPKFVISEKPDADIREAILRPLLNYNVTKVGRTAAGSLAITLQHPDTGATIGGLWATSAYNWLFVELLFVPEEFSRRGIGSSLIRQAEQMAINRGLIGIRLDTMSFQAPGFYEKLGYHRFGTLENYPMGHEHIYFFKMLPGNPTQRN
jgi:GNAT superfamily N-acetyltransferase